MSGGQPRRDTVTDLPIIMSAPMVLALIERRKTKTRRLAWRWPADPENGMHESTPSSWQRVGPGDRLWVREAWAHDGPDLATVRARREDAMTGGGSMTYGPYYRATEVSPDTLKWRPSIFLPRWASRITLTVTATWIEHVQDISEEDAQAEGVLKPTLPRWSASPYRSAFRGLWNDLHGDGAWEKNPDVCVISFSVALRNIDAEAA